MEAAKGRDRNVKLNGIDPLAKHTLTLARRVQRTVPPALTALLNSGRHLVLISDLERPEGNATEAIARAACRNGKSRVSE